MVITSDSGPPPLSASRTLPLGLTSLTRSTEMLDVEIRATRARTLPYTANQIGGYEWVDLGKGNISVVAWYIFAKNGFNPMRLTKAF